MTISYSNPWDFSNKDENMFSPDGQHWIEFDELTEIAMGAPVSGTCSIVCFDKSRFKLSECAGGPVVWETLGRKVAFPIWTRGKKQKIAVANLNARTLAIYSQTFRVLNLKTFDRQLIKGQDSPLHKAISIEFDILKEKIEEIKSFESVI